MTTLVVMFLAFTAVTAVIYFYDNETNNQQNGKELEMVVAELQKMSDEMDVHKHKSVEFEQRIGENERETLKIKDEIATRDNGNKIVANQEIRTIFNNALEKAEVELDIISPWMNEYVVDNEMLHFIGLLLKKNVVVKILFGIGGNSSRNETSELVANTLRDRFEKYPNFHIKHGNTHQKLFICDDRFYVSSSFNILSFKGTYSGDDTREESGEYSENKKRIAEYRAKYFNF